MRVQIVLEDEPEESKMPTRQMVMGKVRQGVFIIIVGTNGTGKTTLIRKLINANGKRVLVVDPDGIEWHDLPTIESEDITRLKQGKRARIVAPNPEDLAALTAFSEGSLVLDDCRYYVKARIEESIRKVFVRRRQRGIDIYAVAHSLNEVPPTFWTFATHLLLFKTTDNPDRLKHNLPWYEEKIKGNMEAIKKHPNLHYHRLIALR